MLWKVGSDERLITPLLSAQLGAKSTITYGYQTEQTTHWVKTTGRSLYVFDWRLAISLPILPYMLFASVLISNESFDLLAIHMLRDLIRLPLL